VYPALLGLFPVLQLAAINPHEYAYGDLLAVLAVAVVALTVTYSLVALLLRRWPADVRAAVMLLIVSWFFFFIPVTDLLGKVAWRLTRPPVMAPVGLVLTAALLWWLLRKRPRLERFSTFMAATGGILVAFSSLSIVRSAGGQGDLVRRSSLARDLARPLPVRGVVPVGRNTPPRDVYVVVVDGYANSEILREYFDFDNGPFEDSLRALGFTVPRVVHSNYAQTRLSIASLLNFEHLTRLSGEIPAGTKPNGILDYLTENNRTALFLKSRGYRFAFFPSAWFEATRTNRHADEQFKAWRGLNLYGELTRTDFRLALRNKTLLWYLVPKSISGRDHALASFAGLKAVPDRDVPTLAFAHFLIPHPPFVLDAGCGAADRPIDWAKPWLDKEGYRGQLRCVNAQLLGVVRTLLARSETPPIIVLQGDHGSALGDQVDKKTVSDVTPAELRERMGAFGAYHLPAGGDSALGDTVTAVNVMRHVLRYYFAADLPPVPDDLNFSVFSRPLEFHRVNELVRGAGK